MEGGVTPARAKVKVEDQGQAFLQCWCTEVEESVYQI